MIVKHPKSIFGAQLLTMFYMIWPLKDAPPSYKGIPLLIWVGDLVLF